MTCHASASSSGTGVSLMTSGGLKADLAAQDLRPHHPVACKAVERVAEGGRAVFLEEEMPDPGEGIAGHEPRQEEPGIQGDDGCSEPAQAKRSPHEMKPARSAIRMFGQVEGIELGHARESFCSHICFGAHACLRAVAYMFG